MARRSFLRQLAGLPLIAAASATAANAPDIAVTPQRPPQFEMEVKTTRLTDSLYVLEGAGGNVAAFVWDDGVLGSFVTSDHVVEEAYRAVRSGE